MLLQPTARANPDSTVYVIQISGVIEKGLASIVERQIKLAEESSAQAVIFEVNTPGGAVDAAGEIRDAIFNCSLPTYAFVNREAISAGALISLACEKVLMVPGSTIGAVTPVDLQGKKASEKVVSYMRGVMRAIAEKRGRDPKIAEAMVDESIEIEGVIEAGKLLTLTSDEALKLNYADKIVDDMDAVLEFIGMPEAEIYEPSVNWSEKLVRFLTNPMISSLLLTLGFLGLIYEVTTQGWGVGGTVGLFALALFFGAQYLVNLANIMEILIFIVGVILLMIEIFVTPGFGLLGILGILAMIGSVIFSLVGNIPEVAIPEFRGAFQVLASSFLLTILLAIPLFKYVPRSRTFRKLVLDMEEKTAAGFRSSPVENERLLNQDGITLTTLRPSGTAKIAGRRVNVISEGEFIEQNSRIRVTRVEGSRIVVKKTEL